MLEIMSKKSKNKNLIAFIGDGGAIMNIQELEYINNFKIPIKIIILNNRCLGNTKLGAHVAFEGRTHANDKKNGYYPPDFRRLSKGFNIPYYSFYNGKKLSLIKKFNKFLKTRGPCIFEVHLSEMQNVAELNMLNNSQNRFFT